MTDYLHFFDRIYMIYRIRLTLLNLFNPVNPVDPVEIPTLLMPQLF
jgi:hypothetical protein